MSPETMGVLEKGVNIPISSLKIIIYKAYHPLFNMSVKNLKNYVEISIRYIYPAPYKKRLEKMPILVSTSGLNITFYYYEF